MACRNERGAARRNCELNACPYTKEKAVGGFHTDKYCEGHSNCREYAQGSCDGRNNRCHYGSWQGGAETSVGCMACRNERGAARRNCELNACPYTKEKAVGGFHTDKYCEGHSNCREYAQGSCDDRNNRCHYGSWQGGAETAVR